MKRQQKYQGTTERLFKVTYELQAQSLIHMQIDGLGDNAKKDIQKYSQLVNYSTVRPFVASKSNSNDEGEGFLTLITPWEDPGEISMSTNRLIWKYWDVCHNVRNAARFDLTQTAKRYGYRGNYEIKHEPFPSSLQQYLK
ncbi:MAG: hypothetical protein KME29_14620 [Calothrix sp. FI2-JRJ7]|jgi:hypothetical protein|nr:hypothetical protein [Calothrix sp. FI2-JRJ7]